MRQRRKGKRVRTKDGELVRVLFVGHHSCIRVIKQCRSLKKLGYKVDLLTHTISYGTQEFNNIYYFHNKHQFMNVMRDVGHLYNDGIVGVHNEPNNMAIWMLRIKDECGFEFPMYHDWHDINSIRLNSADKEEIKIFRQADGHVFVSDPCYDLSKDLYDFKQPHTVFTHYCNKEWNGHKGYKPGKKDIEERKGVVYEGGLNPPDHVMDPAKRHMFRYRTMYYLFRDAVADGNDLTIFAGNPDGYQTHLELGATVHPPTDYDQMMKAMQQHKWGWTLFGEKGNPQTKYTTANKWFEYLKAGCVPIVCWADETAKWTEKLGCGIVLDDPSELGNIEKNFGNQYAKLKDRVDELNISGELDSENHIHKIETLWRNVLDNGKTRVRK